MRSGRLNKVVQLQKLQSTPDDYGQRIESWGTVDTVWAAIEPKRSAEPFNEDQLNSIQVQDVILRYRADIDETWRIVHDDRAQQVRTYEIIALLPPAMGQGYQQLTLECRLLHGDTHGASAP